ncbi:unnamed protein product [Leptosia nina]|uniref:Uncharacterized protein n=1 Tax=Leptosia nina TaxID=320188 RepID=A0AAV1J627_9NEOP
MNTGMRADLTFDDRNERFDLSNLIRQQNKYRTTAFDPQESEESLYRRMGDQNIDYRRKSKRGDWKKSKAIVRSREKIFKQMKKEREAQLNRLLNEALLQIHLSRRNNDFAYHDDMESNSQDVDDFNTNLNRFKSSVKETAVKIDDMANVLHDLKTRRSLPTNDERVSMHYAFPINLKVEAILCPSKQKQSNLTFEISELINRLYTPKQGLNLLYKTKYMNPEFKNSEVKTKYLRDASEDINDPIIDRICKKTGCSCGRSKLLCDAQDVFDAASDVETMIEDINTSVLKDSKDAKNNNDLRCGIQGCKKEWQSAPNKKNFDDLFTTDDFTIDSSEQNSEEHTLLEAVLSELNEITNDNEMHEEKNKLTTTRPKPLTPEDIYDYYRSAMEHLRSTLMGFIKYRTELKVVKSLPKEVRTRIQSIREKYRHFKMSDKQLKKQIFKVLLDDMLKIKIVPDKDTKVSYDVILPDWMYLAVLKMKEGKSLRTEKRSPPKRVLPLTSQQKTRLQKKQGAKKIEKFVWRRSLSSDIGHYGVPFVLDIQGLVQKSKLQENSENNLDYVDNILRDLQGNNNNENANKVDTYDADEMCKKFGRCGCSGPGRCGCSSTRCGKNDEDTLLDDVNAQVASDLNDYGLIDNQNSKASFNNKEKQNNFIPRNKNIKVVIIGPSNIKTFLQSLRIGNKDENPENLLEAVVFEIFELVRGDSDEKLQLKRSRISFSPKEITKFYNEFREQAIQRIFNYVKNIPPKRPLPFLTLKPRREFKRLKKLYRERRMSDLELEQEIINMLLGKKGNMRLLPHKNRNMYEIVVPKWVYVAFYKMRKNRKQDRNLEINE